MQANTKKTYSYWCRRLCNVTGKPNLRDITFSDFGIFFASLRGNAPRTVWNAWQALNAAYRADALWQMMTPAFREEFERTFTMFRPRKLPTTLPLCDTAMISPDTAETWLSAISPESMRIACWLCYDPGLDAAVVPMLTLKDAARIAVPTGLQSAMRQQIRLAKDKRSPYLFPSKDASQPIAVSSLTSALVRAKKREQVKALALPSGAGFRLLQVVGIVRRLREDGKDPEQVRRDAGITSRAVFKRYVDLAG